MWFSAPQLPRSPPQGDQILIERRREKIDTGLMTSSFNTQIMKKNKTSTPETSLFPFLTHAYPQG